MNKVKIDKNIIKELTGFTTLNNDRIRDFMKNEVYGGSWPTLDPELSTRRKLPKGNYKIQICFNHYGAYDNPTEEDAIIYASTHESNGNWTSVNLIYDPTKANGIRERGYR